MKYSDEARFLLERINAVDAAKADATQLVGIQKGLAELVCRMAEDFVRMTDKIRNWKVSRILSAKIFLPFSSNAEAVRPMKNRLPRIFRHI